MVLIHFLAFVRSKTVVIYYYFCGITDYYEYFEVSERVVIIRQSSPWDVMLSLSRFIDWILEKIKNISIYFCALYILCVSKYPIYAKKWFTLREFYSSIYQMPSIHVAKICVIASLLSVFSLHFPKKLFLMLIPAFFRACIFYPGSLYSD